MHTDNQDAYRWLNSGVHLSHSGQHKQALECYEKAIAIDPSYHTAWFNRGTTLSRLGDFPGAINSFSKAIAIFPKDPDYYINLGLAYGTLRDYPSELDAYKHALQFDNGDNLGTLYYNIAICLSKIGDDEQSLDYYNRAIDFNHYDFQALHNRAVVLARLRQYQEALKDLDESLKLSPDQPSAVQLHMLLSAIFVPPNKDKLDEMLAILDILLLDI